MCNVFDIYWNHIWKSEIYDLNSRSIDGIDGLI